MIANELVFMIPVILVQIVGMILALVFIRGRLGPAMCMLIALGASLLFGVGGQVTRQLVLHDVYTGETDFQSIQPVMIAIGAVMALVHAGSLILLIVAALAWRKSPHATN